MSEKPEILPVTRSRLSAANAYDRMSRWYDIMTGFSEKRYRKAGLQMLDAQTGEKILEIGCGTGLVAVQIAKAAGKKGKFTALDISSKMVEKTRQRLVKHDLMTQAQIIQGDAYGMSFPENTFDAVFMSFTLELFDTPDIDIVLKQCYHVLQSHGRLIVVAMSKGEKQGLMLRFYEWLHKRFPNIVDCRPVYAAHSISRAGFRIENVKKMSLAGIPVEIVKGTRNL